MRVRYEMFRSGFIAWQELFDQAARFASSLAPGQVISISHSEDENDGVVTVWYWGEEDPGEGGTSTEESGLPATEDG
jgi:hypothetical protein